MTKEELLEIIQQAVQDRVTELEICGQDLKILPSEIGQLTNLQKLDLESNKLTELPAEIGQLTSLTELDYQFKSF